MYVYKKNTLLATVSLCQDYTFTNSQKERFV